MSRLAAALAGGLGIRPGDRVAYLGYNSPVVLELLFACARLGAVLVPLNWRLAPRRASRAPRATREPSALFAEPEFHAHAEALRGERPTSSRAGRRPRAMAGSRSKR